MRPALPPEVKAAGVQGKGGFGIVQGVGDRWSRELVKRYGKVVACRSVSGPRLTHHCPLRGPGEMEKC
jgi:hypothetical protein